jgi:hypothetical protein
VAIKGKSCILALPYSNITFRATSVKLYLVLDAQINSIIVKLTSKELTSDKLASKLSKELAPLLVKLGKGQPRKNPNITIFL